MHLALRGSNGAQLTAVVYVNPLRRQLSVVMSPYSMVSLLAGVAAGLFYAADIGSIQRWRSVSQPVTFQC